MLGTHQGLSPPVAPGCWRLDCPSPGPLLVASGPPETRPSRPQSRTLGHLPPSPPPEQEGPSPARLTQALDPVSGELKALCRHLTDPHRGPRYAGSRSSAFTEVKTSADISPSFSCWTRKHHMLLASPASRRGGAEVWGCAGRVAVTLAGIGYPWGWGWPGPPAGNAGILAARHLGFRVPACQWGDRARRRAQTGHFCRPDLGGLRKESELVPRTALSDLGSTQGSCLGCVPVTPRPRQPLL